MPFELITILQNAVRNRCWNCTFCSRHIIMVCTLNVTLIKRRQRPKSSKECWYAVQTLWSVKHEKRDKQNITYSQSDKEETISNKVDVHPKINCTWTKSNKI